MTAVTPERVLLALGLLFGLFFLVVVPPFQVPDEQQHMARAVHLSEGHLMTAPAGGDTLPASVVALGKRWIARLPFDRTARTTPAAVLADFAVPLAPEVRREAWIFGLYTPVPYLPQMLGALLGRALGAPALALLYLMRLANLLACLALTVAAVRLAPFFRWTLALLALTPMALFLRSSASADAPTNAVCALLVAAVLALAAGPPEERRRNLAVLAAAAAGAAFCKGAYALLPLLTLAVPRRRLAAGRAGAVGARAVVAGVVLAAVVGFAVAGWLAAHGYSPLRPGVATDPPAQARGMMEHPLRAAGLIAVHLATNVHRYAFQFVGNLGWLDTPLPKWAVVPWLLLLLAVAALDGPAGVPWGLGPRLVAGALVAATVVILCASQYMTWTAVGADFIEGVQGRYFIPVVPFALLLVAGRRSPRLDTPRAGWRLAAAAALMLTIALTTTVLRYYV